MRQASGRRLLPGLQAPSAHRKPGTLNDGLCSPPEGLWRDGGGRGEGDWRAESGGSVDGDPVIMSIQRTSQIARLPLPIHGIDS